MSTNYYAYNVDKNIEPLHIGKSSVGWCFALHIIPELGLNSLNDWIEIFKTHIIINEYDEFISPYELLVIINRDCHPKHIMPPKRHEVDGAVCVGNGLGFYDYITGVFS